jgi:E3 ubiquitin-protein ligase HUWE1
MGFSDRVAKKAIKRIEVPEPTMIIDLILGGKVSDDEDDVPEPKDELSEFEKEISKLQVV